MAMVLPVLSEHESIDKGESAPTQFPLRTFVKQSHPSRLHRASVTSFESSVSSASSLSRSSIGSSVITSDSDSPSLLSGLDYERSGSSFELPWVARLVKSKSRLKLKDETKASQQSSGFLTLPPDLHLQILQHLANSYFGNENGGCITCYLKDLHSLSLTNQSWCKYANQQLYTKVWLPIDGLTNFKKVKGDTARRMKALCRTLRTRRSYARSVREIRLPGLQSAYSVATSVERTAIITAAASLVSLCNNLERFEGLLLAYDHVPDELTSALSTRTRLREKVWTLKKSEQYVDDEGQVVVHRKELSGFHVVEPDQFLNSHHNWPLLETLLLLGSGTGSMDYRSFAATFRNLPSLKHLTISGFDEVQFNNRTLAAIHPNLSSLRLEDLPGVTGKGLLKLASSSSSSLIESLSLINLNLKSVLSLRLFFALPALRRFIFSQDHGPSLPDDFSVPAPVYSSPKLEFLHWDIRAYNSANSDLAASMSLPGSFPRLVSLRAPNDHQGLLQAVCKPTGDLMELEQLPTLHHRTMSMTTYKTANSMYSNFSSCSEGSSLSLARRSAQHRVEYARLQPLVQVVVQEEDEVLHRFTLRNYTGSLESKVEYNLQPNIPGSDEPLADLSDLIRHGVVGEAQSTEAWCGGLDAKRLSVAKNSIASKDGNRKNLSTHERRRKVKLLDSSIMF